MKGHASVVDILLDRKVRCNLQDKLVIRQQLYKSDDAPRALNLCNALP